jgi:predicted nucleic acid-binding protein
VLVIDASLVLEWLLSDARAQEAEVILVRASSDEIWMPSLFWLEVGNVLRMRLRRGLIEEEFRDDSLARVRALLMRADRSDDPSGQTLARTVALSDRFDLTVYDAAYLELALRIGADLGSFDEALCSAAAAAGVTVLGGPVTKL